MPNTGEETLVYDYIICGGGTSGCVVAGRLAEDPSVSVLLIEAGPHCDKFPFISVPGAAGSMFGTEADWNISSEPSPGVNHRAIRLTRGKFLGGSSGLNGTVCIRGMKQDYDDWEMDGWSGAEFFQYMSKAENFVSKPWFNEHKNSHGYSGPVPMSAGEIAPISRLLLESYQSKGFPLVPDMFNTGETPHACGFATRTVVDGVRTTATRYILKDNPLRNITIKTGTLVSRIVVQKTDKVALAIGVEAITQDGKFVFQAKKEVVLSAGAYGSPAILLRSGIGPKEEVEKHGINPLIDLPGVGKNLMDHLIVWMFYEVNEPRLTNDYLINHPNKRSEAIKAWMTDHNGPLSQFPFGSFAFARLDDRLADCELWKAGARESGRDPMGLTPHQPNVEFFNTEAYGGPQAKSPLTTESAFAMISQLFAPHSRGTVSLKSSDPAVNPVVDHQYLSNFLDILVLSEACSFANEIVMSGHGTKSVVKNSWPREPAYHAYKTREDWIPYVRDMATTCYHPAGTCKMGKLDADPFAVVDGQLRLYGIPNLRVADASIIPKLPSGHLQMPAYGIGEKVADMIKEAASAPDSTNRN